ncbi:hypothetical protein [Bradyrhizobium sp.]|uniref:hypothetical protein n=1 Tax=Bradyrhizobium sp. TaxID=376 RepID=UPI003C6FB211
MSSISALGSNQSTYTGPLQQLEAELQSEVSAGTVSSSDQSALSSALTSINSSLTMERMELRLRPARLPRQRSSITRPENISGFQVRKGSPALAGERCVVAVPEHRGK